MTQRRQISFLRLVMAPTGSSFTGNLPKNNSAYGNAMTGMWGSCTPLLIGSRSSLAYLKLGVIEQARSANATFILACYISLNLTILRMAAKRQQSVKSTRRTWMPNALANRAFQNARAENGKPDARANRAIQNARGRPNASTNRAMQNARANRAIQNARGMPNARTKRAQNTRASQAMPTARVNRVTLLFWQDNTILLEVRLCSLAESEPPSHEHFKDCNVLCNEPSSTSADVCEATDKSPGLPETVSSKRLKEKQKGLSACKKSASVVYRHFACSPSPNFKLNQRAGFSSRLQTHLELRALIKLKRPFCNCNFNWKRQTSPEVF